jgi:hypothetical protein
MFTLESLGLFLLFLTSLFLTGQFLVFIIKITSKEENNLRLNKINKIFVLLSLSYIMTYIFI